ncbi:MAG: DmsC/YnfH family molybdoenzyme membrane anchor subunit [Pseudomonadota bacterium]
MHPAPSVIVFTTLSGLGFGMLAWLGLGFPLVTGWVAFAMFALAYALAVGGLLASTFHLGHPERAIKAFSQWRSSWLSREGVVSVATLTVMALYAAGAVFFDVHWALLGWIGAGLSLLTVFCTAMIYAQLDTVPRWKTPLTPVLFMLISMAGGALLAGQIWAAMVLFPVAAICQVIWWLRGDGAFKLAGSTLATATGLGDRGRVRAFEPPHTGTNYLLREFAFEVGRKHADKLRVIALTLGFVIPFSLLWLPFSYAVVLIAGLSHLAGIAASRWLFFAQAEHVVGLYYGKR